MKNAPLYSYIIDITEDYLGPAAERFINRQIENHLQKNPKDLEEEDLPKLINWSKLALSVITEDTDMVDEFAERLESISQSNLNHGY